MSRQQWRIRVRGRQRKQVKVDLLVAAVMAMAERWQTEQTLREQVADLAVRDHGLATREAAGE
jgi:hypothetical protein